MIHHLQLKNIFFAETEYKETKQLDNVPDRGHFEDMFEVRRAQDIELSDREVRRCIQFYKWVEKKYEKIEQGKLGRPTQF